MPQIQELELYDTIEKFDADGGIIAVPNTGIMTTLQSLDSGPVSLYLDQLVITVYDAPAIPIVAWQILVNGQPLYPWVNQKMPGGQFALGVEVARLIQPLSTVRLQASIPATAVGAFDVTGRFRAAWMKRRDLPPAGQGPR